MLEMIEFVLTGAEVRKASPAVPKSVMVNVSVDKLSPKSTDTVILSFTYAVDYAPSVASVRIAGEALCRDTPDNIRKMLAEFKKRKSLPVEYGQDVINLINASAGLNSVFLVRPFNLMPPFMPPPIAGPVKQKGE
jgi:hypothetical protein